MTYSEFMAIFPNNDACMDFLRDKFYPAGSACQACGKETKFHRVNGRAAYACQYCRAQVYPTAGTIFHKTTTSLQLWFWAVYLMSSTRCGISAKQLEREIGVSYPTAHRMFKQIRSLLTQDDEPLFGIVEADETRVGGKPRKGQIKSRQDVRRFTEEKAKVAGVVQRGGKVRARVVPDVKGRTLVPFVQGRVLPASTVYTDELKSYRELGRKGYTHRRVNHSERVYVDGDVHTQTIEGFWALLKGGIGGVYHSVSDEYLQAYVDEYAWRYNHRDDPRPMFWTFLDQVRKGDGPAA
jgi:transposase-like protein